MKKLKRFSVKSMTVLSNQEMALINGGIVIDALDHCEVDDQGKKCIYQIHNIDGHDAYVIGTCYVTHGYQGGHYVVTSQGCQ